MLENLSEELAEEYIIWRLVTKRIATLYDLETNWNLDDINRANAMLDMQSDIELYYQQKHEKEMKKRSKK